MIYTLVEISKTAGLHHHKLRFGEPVFTFPFDRSRSYAAFETGQIFAYIRWRKNDYGTVHWQLIIARSGRETLSQSYPGIYPCADVLFRARGVKAVRDALIWLDRLEAKSAKPLTDLPLSFWRKAQNAIHIRAKLPALKRRQLEPFHV